MARLVTSVERSVAQKRLPGFNRAARLARLVTERSDMSIDVELTFGFNRAARLARLVTSVAQCRLPVCENEFQ